MNENNIHSKAFRTCTPCCPFDMENLPHPRMDLSSMNMFDMQQLNGTVRNSDVCCLSRLQVDCRIQCPKKKKKSKKNKRLNSTHSYLNTKRSISSAKSVNNDFDASSSSSLSVSSLNTTASNLSQQSYSSNKSNKKSTYQNKSSSITSRIISARKLHVL